MSEEVRLLLVNNLKPEDYMIITDNFHKLEKEIKKLNKELENLEKLNNANYQSFIEVNNIINELERYINEEYIYDELGMKIFDASKLQDKLQELKGSEKE